MRRMLATVTLATCLGVAVGAFPKAGTTNHTVWWPASNGAVEAEAYGPVSPIDPQPQPQPIWIIRIPL